MVKKGDTITVTNKDTLPHTVTSGTGPSDPNSAKSFDTSIIEGGATAEISTAVLDGGDYPFYCTVHPYMTGKLELIGSMNGRIKIPEFTKNQTRIAENSSIQA